MQVKKFEAKSMKEALELVKVHLGPEAIILSARDTKRGFGLMGDKSVEVTAAVSDETLRKKKMAEARMRDDLREKFQQIPASRQKSYIERSYGQRKAALVSPDGLAIEPERISDEVRARTKGMRYIDIGDEEQQELQRRMNPNSQQAAMVQRQYGQTGPAGATTATQARPQTAIVQQPAAQAHDVMVLQSQVRELKELIERFQKVPQVPMSLHPGAEQGLPFEFSATYQRLTNQGIHPNLVATWLRKAQKEMDAEAVRKPAFIDAWIARHIMDTVQISSDPLQGRYHVFMGTAGQGKTTTLVKFAGHLLMKERRTLAMISLDTVKLGASDQLRLYAQILNVPFAVVRNPEEWRVAEQKLRHVQTILVDCPGLTFKSMDEIEWLKSLLPPASMDRRLHYVQSILARDEEVMDTASRYQMLGFHDAIFTRLDESSRQGLMLNFQDRMKVPIHSFGMGPRIPEDFELAHKERVVDFIYRLRNVGKKEDTI